MTTIIPPKIRAGNSSITHYEAREVPTRFGPRYVALCGVSISHLAYRSSATMCPRCVAKVEAR
jgi:hypothetical protein